MVFPVGSVLGDNQIKKDRKESLRKVKAGFFVLLSYLSTLPALRFVMYYIYKSVRVIPTYRVYRHIDGRVPLPIGMPAHSHIIHNIKDVSSHVDSLHWLAQYVLGSTLQAPQSK